MEGTLTVSQKLTLGQTPHLLLAQGKKKKKQQNTSSAAICWEHQLCEFFGLDFLRKHIVQENSDFFLQIEVNLLFPTVGLYPVGLLYFYIEYLLLTLLVTRCVGLPTSLQQQPRVLLLNSVPTLSTLR